MTAPPGDGKSVPAVARIPECHWFASTVDGWHSRAESAQIVRKRRPGMSRKLSFLAVTAMFAISGGIAT
ncbi:MAG: hypothetical protein R3B97_06670 [Dehalococcoidia bacterium]